MRFRRKKKPMGGWQGKSLCCSCHRSSQAEILQVKRGPTVTAARQIEVSTEEKENFEQGVAFPAPKH